MTGEWLYVDTSVLVKRCIQEPGSQEASHATFGYLVVTSALTPLETLSALHAKHRGGTLTAAAFRACLRTLEMEHSMWTLVELSPAVLRRAEILMRDVSTRTLDALHIASALFFQETGGTNLPFLTADGKQLRSAQATGLAVRWLGHR